MITNPLIPIFFAGGVALGSLLEGYLKKKTPLSMEITAGILIVSVLLILWNVWMYRKAFAPPRDEKFPETMQDRFSRPVTATVCFVMGFLFLFILPLFG